MKVYVSSTSLDLKEHRQAVIEILHRSGHVPVCMEYIPATDVVPKDKCMKEVSACDAYIGIFAWRYGYVPPKCEMSITEMEYRTAIEQRIPALVFLLNESVHWPEEFRDKGVNGQQIKKLRDELQQTKWVTFFTSADNLEKEVVAALQRLSPPPPERVRVPIPLPKMLVQHFQDRGAEICKLRKSLTNK